MKIAVLALLLAGCFSTSVHAPGTILAGPEYSTRQWFTLGGLVGLSDAGGQECQKIAYAKSEAAAIDVLLGVGIGIVGAMIGSGMCEKDGEDAATACAITGAQLAPFLLASRTVRYQCAAEATVQLQYVPQVAPAPQPAPVQYVPVPQAPQVAPVVSPQPTGP
jgi:hypothetical protein